MEMEEKGK